MLRQQEAATTSMAWQILQLAPTATPGMPAMLSHRLHAETAAWPEMLRAGRFNAWVLAGPRLYSIPVRVPRTVYINSSAAPGDARVQALGATCKRTLPHGHQAQHIFKVCVGWCSRRCCGVAAQLGVPQSVIIPAGLM